MLTERMRKKRDGGYLYFFHLFLTPLFFFTLVVFFSFFFTINSTLKQGSRKSTLYGELEGKKQGCEAPLLLFLDKAQ